MKTCETCHQPKPLSGFYPSPASSDGYAAVCRACTKASARDRTEITDKFCSRCGKTKPIDDFSVHRARSDGRQQYCKPCTREYANTYYATVSHDCIVSKAYGLERGQYGAMLLAQGGVCDMCGQSETATLGGRVKRLAIDHDHSSGSVRALLCLACNALIGYAQDDKERLLAAIAYLERHTT